MEYIAHIREDGNVQLCREHAKNTAEKAAFDLKTVGLENTGYLAGLCHDVGKYSHEFQEYIAKAARGEPVEKGSVIHSFAGTKYIIETFHPVLGNGVEKTDWERLTAEIIATAIGSHHGLIDEIRNDDKSALQYRCDKQPQCDASAIKAFLYEYSNLNNSNNLDALFEKANEEISNSANKCIELATENGEQKMTTLYFYLGLMQRLVNSSVMDGDRSDTAEYMQDIRFRDFSTIGGIELWEHAIRNLETYIDKFPQETAIQKARREMSDLCAKAAQHSGGVYRLCMPTGGGKTLSGLRYALIHAKKFNKKRIILTAPLLSVLDQNADVVRSAVGIDDAILEHHSDVITEDMSTEELKRYEIMSETWDAPIILTTFVQLLNSMFGGKTAAVRRFHSLCDSVIVIDEIQNVPDKLLSLFTLTINFLSDVCGSTIVLCSATQPALEENTFKMRIKGDIIPQKELNKYNLLFKRTQTDYIGELSLTEIITHAEEISDEYGNLLIICNTKRDATKIYLGLTGKGNSCIYLSTALCMAHRKEKLKELTEILKAEHKVICVSTQLIEAGVDISFSSVIRLMAGIDNIAQAAGRCNRHGENGNAAPVEIVSLKGEKLTFLKEIEESKKLTRELIAEFDKQPDTFENDLISSNAVKYFFERKADYLNSHREMTNYVLSDGGSMLDLLSGNMHSIRISEIIMRQAYKTAGQEFEVFDSNTKTIIVPYNEEAENIISELYNIEHMHNWNGVRLLIDAAKPYTVQVFEYMYDKLKSTGAVVEVEDGTIAILQSGYYDTNLGLIDPQEVDVNMIDESYVV